MCLRTIRYTALCSEGDFIIRWQKSTLCYNTYITLGLHLSTRTDPISRQNMSGSIKQCLECQLVAPKRGWWWGTAGWEGYSGGHQWRSGQSLSPFIIIYLVLRFKNTHYHASLPSHSHIFIMIFFQPRHIFLIPGDKMTRVWGQTIDIILFSQLGHGGGRFHIKKKANHPFQAQAFLHFLVLIAIHSYCGRYLMIEVTIATEGAIAPYCVVIIVDGKSVIYF